MYKLYNDLMIEIKEYQDEIENAKQIRYKLDQQLEIRKPKEINGQVYSDMPKGSRDDTSMDRTLQRIEVLTNRINAYGELVEERLRHKAKLDAAFKKCEGLYYKVYDLNRIQKIPLEKVAEILGYSSQYIKEISADISKGCKNDVK